MRILLGIKYWWIFVLFFRCISGSIFNIPTGSKKLETFENILKKESVIFGNVTKRMEEIVTEKSNLLLDYVGKFINQMSGNANPAVKLTKSQSIISNDGLRGCEMPIDVEECIPFINYLDKKHHQLYGLSRVFDLITNFFTRSFKKCDTVMNKKKCQTAIMKLYQIKIKVFENRLELLGNGFRKRVREYDFESVAKCLKIDKK